MRKTLLDDVCEPRIEMCDPRHTPKVEFRYIDISSVDNVAKRIVSPSRISGAVAPSRARQRVRTGDVLVATTRPNLNAVALVGPELDGEIASTGFCVLRAKAESLAPEFLHLWVRHPCFVESLSSLVQGALYPAVSDRQVRAQPIPLPPLARQREIVAHLDDQLAATARARAAVAAQLADAEKLFWAILRIEFSAQNLTAAPHRRLDEIASLLPSRSVTNSGDALVPVATSACLTERGFSPKGIRLNRLDTRSLTDCVARRGEIWVARSNTDELVGRAAYFPGTESPTYVADLLMRIECGDLLDEEFTAFFLSHLYTTGYWRERAGGASGTMKKIRREQLLAVKIPVVAKTKQRSLAVRVGTRLSAGQAVVAHLTARLADLDRLPAALLREAFAG